MSKLDIPTTTAIFRTNDFNDGRTDALRSEIADAKAQVRSIILGSWALVATAGVGVTAFVIDTIVRSI